MVKKIKSIILLLDLFFVNYNFKPESLRRSGTFIFSVFFCCNTFKSRITTVTYISILNFESKFILIDLKSVGVEEDVKVQLSKHLNDHFIENKNEN